MMKRFLLICCFASLVALTGYAQSSHPTTGDPAQKAKELQKQLKLNNTQTNKIAGIYEESAKKFEKIKVADNGNTSKMTVDMKPLRAATVSKIKAVLTPAQAAKYNEMVKTSKDSYGNGWSDGWSASDSGN